MLTETEAVLEFNETVDCDGTAAAVIVAGGASSRMKGIQKATAGILGIPVIARTLRAFQNARSVGKIVLVAREEDIPRMQCIADNYLITKLTDIVSGGADRQHSVMNGLAALDDKDKIVLIHDGARPLVSQKIINDVTEAAIRYGAAAPGIPLKDTVAHISDDGFADSTPDRASLRAMQTPQGFDKELYLKCAKEVDLSKCTDDCSVVQACGKKVFVTEGELCNIKITTPEDIALAELYLKLGGEGL